MNHLYTIFKTKECRVVPTVVKDILEQQAEFTAKIDSTCQLNLFTSGLLEALEKKHKVRTGNLVDLSKDPLLLILELSDYYLTSKGTSFVTSKDGFSPELEGALKGGALLPAYRKWCESTQKSNPKEFDNQLKNLLNKFQLNDAAALASQLEYHYKKMGGPSSC